MARVANSVISISTNAAMIPSVTDPPVQYWTCAPNHSASAGCGPQTVAHRTSSTKSRNHASAPSARRRRRAATSGGSAGKRTGRVPGRLPMNRPPVSVGSLLAILDSVGMRSRAPRRVYALPGVERLHHAGELLVHDVALDLQRRGQLAGLLREVVIEDRELL